MIRIFAASILALAVTASTAPAAKQAKSQSQVQKALKDRYPDAQTKITATNEVNGVKVYDVDVTNKMGQSTAQITDYGDFLMYGIPHEYASVQQSIKNNVSGLFKTSPDDVEMYRVTNYYVDFKDPDGKTFTARFDAVGRLEDITNQNQMKEETAASTGKQLTDQSTLTKAQQYASREIPGSKVKAVYQAGPEENGFWNVQLDNGGQLIVNQQGQVYSLRQPITPNDFPEPVAKTIQGIFSATITKLWRGEYEYYQFDEKSQTGAPIVVKMRPNGDILQVINTAAQKDEQAERAKSKAKAAKKG